MKRITALAMALAIVLSLAACGGKNTDQPSNNTPPVTQGEQDQPSNSPDNSAQPAESTNTSETEPQNDAGELPDGEFYLYDGVHHLSAVNYGDSYINSTVISGEKIANVPHEMFVELTEHITNEYLGSMLITLGQNSEPFNYQISFTEEDTAEYYEMVVEKKLAPGETNYFGVTGAYISVVNLTDTEKSEVDCPIIHFTTRDVHVDQYVEPNGKITLDGKSIATLDDLINILGTPTAAFSENSPESIQYIWQSEDFVYTAAIWCEFEEIFDENRQYPYFDMKWDTAQVIEFSYYALNYEVDETNILTYEPWSITFPVQALTDLGLL